jgi:hypothetical protein
VIKLTDIPRSNKWNDYKKLPAQGFISNYQNFILEKIKTHPEWAESLAVGLISTVSYRINVRNKQGKVRPNLWTIVIGNSGIAKKSSPVNSYVKPVLKQIEEKLGNNVHLRMPSDFTKEGMIAYLSGHMRRNNEGNDEEGSENEHIYKNGIIIRDEFSQIFSGMRKDYLKDTLEFFSELYDGTDQFRVTKGGAIEEVGETYVSLLGATTPTVYSSMDRNFFVQGTGNRFMYIIVDPKTILYDQKGIKFWLQTPELQHQLDADVTKFAELLSSVPESGYETLPLSIEALSVWSEYDKEKSMQIRDMVIEDKYDQDHTYLARMAETVLKFSIIHCISRNLVEPLGQNIGFNPNMEISGYDMKWAIGKVERHVDHMRTLLINWRIEPTERRVETINNNLSYILSVFEDCADGFLTAKEILSKAGLSKNTQFYDYLATLIDLGKLEKLSESQWKNLPKEIKTKHGYSTGPTPQCFRLIGYNPTNITRMERVE